MNTGDTLKRREVAPGVYQCGCRWVRAEEDRKAFEAGVRGDVLQLCPIHKQWNESRIPMEEVIQATVGRTVLYTYQEADLPPGYKHRAGEVRPATVVRVWPDEYPHSDGSVEPGYNLQVLTDRDNDGLAEGTLWKTSVRLAATPTPGACHWPLRVKDADPQSPPATS